MPDDDDDGSAVGVGVGLGNGTSSGLSWVVLAVEAEADYFSMDRGLMRDGLVVDFDVGRFGLFFPHADVCGCVPGADGCSLF